ncbi:MAG TPA: sigma-70 family RNA polymerase sigma factor [Bacteroidota bacterium]|nr:sigma-70 family RNA polymerase sigma factor [Bacteroidota bacterium]
MTAADEQQLILRVKEGSHEAFRILVERYMKHAYNVAYGFVSDHDDAEDIAQESFVRAYQSIGSFRGEAGFGTWLYRIVTNLSLNRVRQKKQIAAREVHDAEESLLKRGDGLELHEVSELKMHIERTLHELPTLQRAAVILRHINGLSTKQVSSILQCSEGTVKTHLYRGLKKMKIKMKYLKDE